LFTLPFMFAMLAVAAALAYGVNHSSAAADRLSFQAGAGIPRVQQIAAAWGRGEFVELAAPEAAVPPAQVDLPILMYHHVRGAGPGDSELTRGLTVDPAAFETQLAYLQQQGYRTVSMRQLYTALYQGEPLPERSVLLTFDDGYADSYAVAAPLLEKYGFSGTFFIVTGLVGSEGYMNWDQVVELERMGMEIGSHTASHPDLTVLDGGGLEAELAGSAAALSERLAHPVYWLCYPAGAYNEEVLGRCLPAGYLLSVTTEPGQTHSSGDPYRLPRWRVGPGTTLEQFAFLVE